MIRGLDSIPLSQLLREVRRPGRYSGNEINFPQKRTGDVTFLLCFPDLYDIGMSNLGLRVLYHVLNRRPDILADICFAPWPDMEAVSRRHGLDLVGLGTGRAARNFDIIGFSLQHELQYTNVLNMLDLAGVPLVAEERDGGPVIVAGGPCAFNPEPMAAFIDAFAVGDGETVACEIARTVGSMRGRGRNAVLERLAEIQGVYVPSVHSGVRVSRRVEPALRDEDFPLPPIVPLCPITHDRLTVEVMRGCTRGCRFCSAGMLSRPVRQRSVDSVARLVESGIDASGWEEVSLVSLSTSDYYDLAGLVDRLDRMLSPRRVGISLPSMRPGTFSEDIARRVGHIRKTGLTFAPEAGSESLRKAINKGIDEDHLYATVETAFKAGWDVVKLYFMIGLPGETDEDIGALVTMVRSVESICRVYGKRKRITASVSPFVPRPHTPFQWATQLDPETMFRRISAIRKGLPDKRVRLKWRDPYMAHLEDLLARGDRGIGRVIMDAWRRGSRFDGWTDRFDFDLWQRCFEEHGLGPEAGARILDPDRPLPWDHIDGGVSRDFLLEERRRSIEGLPTPDCRIGPCSKCGACPGPDPGRIPDRIEAPSSHAGMPAARGESGVSMRFRVRFSKRGKMLLTSHLDLLRCIQRGLRRSGQPVCYSRGFSPHVKISLGPPLPLGVAGDSEFFDVLMHRMPPEDWLESFNRVLPGGLQALEARLVTLNARSLTSAITAAAYTVEIEGVEDHSAAALTEAIREALGRGAATRRFEASFEGNCMSVDIESELTSVGPRPEKVLAGVLGQAGVAYRLVRRALYAERDGELSSPFETA